MMRETAFSVGAAIAVACSLASPGSILAQRNTVVPAAPNEGLVTGRVVGFSITQGSVLGIQPDVPIYGLHISVESVEDVEGMRNFARNYAGKILHVMSKQSLDPGVFGKQVKVRVTYGVRDRFWSRSLDVIGGQTGKGSTRASPIPKEVPDRFQQTRHCDGNSDCAPCGKGCIPSSLAPFTECTAFVHDDCACIQGRCERRMPDPIRLPPRKGRAKQ